MRHIVGIGLLGILVAFGQGVLAYEIETHGKISEAAGKTSVLKTDNDVLRHLGLQFSIEDDRQQFPNSKGEPRNVLNLIIEGSKFEDSAARALNHFYDPWYNRPLAAFGAERGERSPDWALEDRGDVDGQDFSLKNARQYLYDALTAKDSTERDERFGLLFQSLGQVIHHLQDMAQPQHVRNDTHCDQWYCRAVGLYHPSGYEKYTDLREVRDNLRFDGYGPVTFVKPRELWSTLDGQGMADFTNRNFVSAGTNYQLLNGQPAPNALYPQPVPLPGESVDIKTLFGEEGKTTDLEGMVDFVQNRVDDHRSGGQTLNPRSASLSIFDADLKTYNRTVTYDADPLDPNFNAEVTVDRLLTLNRFNYRKAHEFLLPRAVAYSAGLIDYFFRGRLEAEDVEFTDTGIRLRVKNAIDPATAPAWKDEALGPGGTLLVAYDYRGSNGATHYRTSNAVSFAAAIAPGNISDTTYTFNVTVPQGASDVHYRLVFRGRLGQEDDAIAVGSIEGAGGFVIHPSTTPYDGITGTRVIVRRGGQWSLSKETGQVAGNIDWKGWYVNGKPTKVLSWDGPAMRYAPGGFAPYIYQDGKRFAIAPLPVHGAALLRGSEGNTWLIAICSDGAQDLIYRRPGRPSDSADLLDPTTNPDGWELIASLANPPGTLPADRAWFFNGEGTEAQTMRARTDGTLTRLKISVSESSAGIKDLGNSKITTTSAYSWKYENCEWITGGPPFPTIQSRRESNAVGETVVAVDYVDRLEVLARVVVDSAYSHVIDGAREGDIDQQTTVIDDRAVKTLRFGAVEIPLLDVRTTDTESGSFAQGVTRKVTSSVGTAQIAFLDLRNDIVLYRYEKDEDEASAFAPDTGTRVPWTWTGRNLVEYRLRYGQTSSFHRDNSSSSTTTTYDPQRSQGFKLLWQCFDNPYMNGSGASQDHGEYSEHMTTIDLSGGIAVDRERNALLSLRYQDAAGTLRSFDFLTGGDLRTLTGITTGDPVFYPVGAR